MTLNYDKIAEKAAQRGSEMAPASDAEGITLHTNDENTYGAKDGAHTMSPAPENEPKPTALQQAQSAWRNAQHYYEVSEEKDGNAFYRSMGETAKQDAATLAAIAQAESLERIANAVERLVSDAKRREGEL